MIEKKKKKEKNKRNSHYSFLAPKFTSKLSLIKWDEMSAIDIYNLQRALVGLYSLTTKFRNTTIKLLDIKKIEKPNHLSHIEPNIPGKVKEKEKNRRRKMESHNNYYFVIVTMVLERNFSAIFRCCDI